MPSLRSRIIYQAYRLTGSQFDTSTPLEQQRQKVDRNGGWLPLPAGLVIEPVKIGELYAEWLDSPGTARDRAILYLHGGGYTMGSCKSHRALAARIAVSSQAPVLNIDYRLAPENQFPAALQDTLAACEWLRDQGIAAEKIVIAGDSAGGGLAAAASVSLRDEGQPLPAGIVCISPWADLSLSGQSYQTNAEKDPMIKPDASQVHAARYTGEQDVRSPLISPVYADLSGFPPMLIQVGEDELLRSDSETLASNACRDGVPVTLDVWEGMLHVWHMYFPFMPEANTAIEKIGAFIRGQITDQRSVRHEQNN